MFCAQIVDAATDSLVFEITGKPSNVDSFIAILVPLGLVPTGRYLMVIADISQMIAGKFQSQVIDTGSDESKAVNKEAYGELLDLTAKGILKPVIDRVVPFEQIVEAYRHVDSGHKRGSVVVTVP